MANRPGVSSVILGATKLNQLEQTVGALDFNILQELANKLDEVSKPDQQFPYTFFTPGIQSMLTGGTKVGDKPSSYGKTNFIDAAPAGVE